MTSRLPARLLAEFLGTAFLLTGVVGSGIMAERLSDDVGLQLLENSLATAGILVALILALGPLSGAHFNPAVTIADWALGGFDRRDVVPYIAAQVFGGAVGVMAANVMFDLDVVNVSTKGRPGANLWFSEGVATFGLLLVIFTIVRAGAELGKTQTVAWAVGGYIAGAYWFTSSTSFANPAVTVARTLSDTFAGIAPSSAPAFIVAQIAATGLAIAALKILTPEGSEKP